MIPQGLTYLEDTSVELTVHGRKLLEDFEERAREWGESRGTKDSVSLVRSKGDQYLYFGKHSAVNCTVLRDEGVAITAKG